MSIANILKYLQWVTLLMPLIEQIISIVEEAFAQLGGGLGVKKKAAAKALAKAALTGSGLSVPDEAIDEVIDSMVALKNQTGEFSKGAPRAPPILDSQEP